MKKTDFSAEQVMTFRKNFNGLLIESFGPDVLILNLESSEPFWFLCRPKGWSSKIRLNYKPLLGAPHVVDVEFYENPEHYAKIAPPIGATVVNHPSCVSFDFAVPKIDIRTPFEENTEALSIVIARMAQLKTWVEAQG
ncbi:MAG: hypothetical protein IE922_02190 [Sphingomonadales bacterium]|nr:hypothetical protein [Sphingomonadales bacterium]